MTYTKKRQIIANLMIDVYNRLERQMDAFPTGFPADRNGIRLGIAAIEDELEEAKQEWYVEKRGDDLAFPWLHTYDELLDVIAVAIYTAVDIRRVYDDVGE